MNIKLIYLQPILNTQEVSKILNQSYSVSRSIVLQIRRKHKIYYQNNAMGKASVLSVHLAEYLDISKEMYNENLKSMILNN